MITVTSVEAQSKFGQLLDTAQRGPVIITRHGRATAYMVSPQDMQELHDLQAARRKRREAVAEFEAHFTGTDAHLTPAVRELTDEDVLRLVKESR